MSSLRMFIFYLVLLFNYSNLTFNYSDEGVSCTIQEGLQASRATVKWFKHNDVSDLTMLLEWEKAMGSQNAKAAKNRSLFIVVEGIYVNHGDLCLLPEIVSTERLSFFILSHGPLTT